MDLLRNDVDTLYEEIEHLMGHEQLQQFAKSTWHRRIFAKITKNSLQQVGRTTWQFCELGKIIPSLGKYAKSESVSKGFAFEVCI